MKLQQRAEYHFLFKSLDILLDYTLNFLTAYAGYLIAKIFFVPKDPIGTTQATLLILALSLLASLLYNYHQVYLPMRTQTPLFFLGRIFLVNLEVLGVCALISALASSERNLDFYVAWSLLTALISFLVIASKKVTMLYILHSIRARQKNTKRILLITDSQEMADEYMEEILENPQFGYQVIGYIGNLHIMGLTHIGTTGDLDRILETERPDEVVIAMDTVRKKLVTRYITICNNHCAKVMVVPAICGYFKSPKQISMLGNLPMVDIRSTPLDNIANRAIKRTMDIVGSAILLVVTSPLMLFTAIGVKLSSPGPILFKQVRVGRKNREFTMYKFRSMRVNDSQQTGWSTDEDPRKTRFGNFIRKFALDELPQFYNVLKGDMSLVGPRPEVPFYVEKFKTEIPLYMLKHTLRPGITGLAQIKGLRGDTSIEARIEEDISYIENWSVGEDIRILLLTPLRAINRHEKFARKEKQVEERNRARFGDSKRGKEGSDHDS